MGVTLEVAYGDAAALKHDADTQLRKGGLYVTVDASALPPLCELTLRLVADELVVEAAARLTVATAQAACIEIAAAPLGALLAAVDAHVGDVAPAAGVALARFVDDTGPVRFVDDTASARVVDDTAAAHVVDDTAAARAADGDVVAPDTRGQIPLDRKIATMSVGEKIQLALHGNRDARQLLMRDRAGVVQSSLVRNPKITLDEVQALARAPQLAPDTAETLAQHPTYGLSPQIAMALVRNPRTPLPVATLLVARLQPADLRAVAKGLGVRTQVAAVARKRLVGD